MADHGKLCPVVNNHIGLGCACNLAYATRIETKRCHVTWNPCGTDTWQLGYVCPCPACVEYMKGRAREWPCMKDPNEGLRGPVQHKSKGDGE